MNTTLHATPKSWKVLFVIYAIGLATLMALAYLDVIETSIWGLDKIGHFFLVGIASFLAHKVLGRKKVWKNRIALGPLLVLVFFGIEECVQRFSPARSFSFFDFLADVIGVFFFMLIEKRWPEIGPIWAIEKMQRACAYLYWQLGKLKEK